MNHLREPTKACEYSHEEAVKFGVGVRFISMRRVAIDNMAVAFYMHPVRPGELGYKEARYEVQGASTCEIVEVT